MAKVLTKEAGRHREKAGGIGEFAFKGDDIAADITAKYGAQGDLLDIFIGVAGARVNKWHHYLPIYDRYFGPWRDRSGKAPLRFLEIGVAKGGSLAMWRRYFGPDAVIFGIDINPACAEFNGQHGQVRIGSQTDAGFLRTVVHEMGGVDVVLDDGSHRMADIRASLDTLFPLLSLGGTYMIEDLHTSYWTRFGGGLRSEDNFFNFVRRALDDIHHWYHYKPIAHPHLAPVIAAMHLHDSIVVLDKAQVYPPTYSVVGDRPSRGKGAV